MRAYEYKNITTNPNSQITWSPLEILEADKAENKRWSGETQSLGFGYGKLKIIHGKTVYRNGKISADNRSKQRTLSSISIINQCPN